jgi:hypothetical protein
MVSISIYGPSSGKSADGIDRFGRAPIRRRRKPLYERVIGIPNRCSAGNVLAELTGWAGLRLPESARQPVGCATHPIFDALKAAPAGHLRQRERQTASRRPADQDRRRGRTPALLWTSSSPTRGRMPPRRRESTAPLQEQVCRRNRERTPYSPISRLASSAIVGGGRRWPRSCFHAVARARSASR